MWVGTSVGSVIKFRSPASAPSVGPKFGEVGSLLTPISNNKSTTAELNTNRYAPFGGKCTVWWWYGLVIFLVWKSYVGFLYNSITCLCVSCLIDSLLTRGLKKFGQTQFTEVLLFLHHNNIPIPNLGLSLSLSLFDILCVFFVQFLYSYLKLYNVSALDTLSATAIFILFHLTKLYLDKISVLFSWVAQNFRCSIWDYQFWVRICNE